MNDAFVPLVTAAPKPRENGFVALAPKASAVEPMKNGAENANGTSPAPAAEPCNAKPTVTLQRNGDIVTGIKVQCSCGQIIELSCVY